MSLKQCRFFILDEADGLLKGGYENLINRLHQQIPKMTSDGARLQVGGLGRIFGSQFLDFWLNPCVLMHGYWLSKYIFIGK